MGLSTAGVPLALGPPYGDVLLFATLSHIVADGEGFELLYQWRGASSMRPCLRHWNMVPCGSGIAHRSEDFQELSCADPSKMFALKHSDYIELAGTVVHDKTRKEAGVISNAEYKRTLKASGFNCTIEGFLMCVQLMSRIDVARCLTLDWMHTALQDGFLTVELTCFLAVAKISFDDMRAFLKDESWHWSGRGGTSHQMHHIFHPRRGESGKIKAAASVLLGLYGMVRYYAEKHLIGAGAAEESILKKATLSFNLACDFMDTSLLAMFVALRAECAQTETMKITFEWQPS